MKFTQIFALLLLGLAGSAAGAAGDFATADLRPLLQIHTHRNFVPDPQNPFPVGDSNPDELFFVSRGGATIWVQAEQGGTSPFHTTLLRGLGSKEDFAKLKADLTAARVGVLRSCSLFTAVEGVGQTTGAYGFTWYGQGTRRNDFTIELLGKGGAPSHPLCGPEVSPLIDSIRNFVFEVGLEPGSEVLTSMGQLSRSSNGK